MRVGIVGAGIAGPTLAWWLQHHGIDSVLYETAPQLRTGGYVIDFWGVGYDVAEKMGLLTEIHRRGYDFSELRLVDGGGRTSARLDVEVFREFTNGRFVSIARSDLSALIWDACGGLETHFGVTVDQIEQDPNGIHVSLTNGNAEDFDLLVGADGLHSKVRELAFGPSQSCEKPLGYYVAAFQCRGYERCDELIYVAHSAPHRQVARIGLRDDNTVFFFILAAHLLDSEPVDEATQRQAIREVFGEMQWEAPQILQQLDSAEGFYFDRVSQITMDRWTNERVALIGDAAACVSLLAGEGTGLAMTEAYVLAGELQKANGAIGSALRQYEAKMQPFLRQKQKSARAMASFFAPKSRLDMIVRDLGINALRIPFVAKFALGRSFRDDFELPTYNGALV